MKQVRFLVALLACAAACAHPAPPPSPQPAVSPPVQGAARPITLSIIGTNDLHGALERLPLFAGFVANLRAARAADGGGVVLVDGGDMFQGTLESNLAEGADVVRAYNQVGYAAVAIGNHEFDYGPAGPKTTPASPADDPRGALKARIAEAKYPFLAANVVDAKTGARPDWPNLRSSTLIEVDGVKIGIIGASTESTPTTTMPINFAGLAISPTAQAINAEAQALRAQGAKVVIATMHIGSNCKDVEHHDDTSSCDKADEIWKVIAGLPKGAVDVIVGGHTHAGMAHRIDGMAVIESYANGRAFGRIDLTIAGGAITGVAIDKPRLMCALDKDHNPVPVAQCQPGTYEGKPVVADPAVQGIVDEAVARATVRRNEQLGVTLTATVTRAHGTESAEGNLIADLMLAARPDVQVTMTNGGGLRADLPAGPMTYGQLFESAPFDNRFAIVDVTGKDLVAMITDTLTKSGGILSFGGLTATARCKANQLDVQVKVGGKPVTDKARYKLATSDFLASGGDGVIGKLGLPEGAIKPTDVIIRDGMADVLRSWKATPKATIDPARLLVKKSPRLDYEGKRPVTCGGTP
ncbi:MAG TPA: bifunctional UDP-sugar hydrolase/5'-nucleotidase [Kofleriaceae bacterium]